MRLHFARISSSKKATISRADINMDSKGADNQDSPKLEDGSYTQPKTVIPKNPKNCELRENPKKSWKISDPKHGLSTASCRDCGKEFPTLRALSGRIRSHSISDTKQIHQCKTCGKGFESIRAMFGHMKSHPKRSRIVLANESSEGLSDLENLGPVRKKRSIVRYKSTILDPNIPSFSNLNESDSAVLELGEVEEVAEILILLSRDAVRNSSKFDSSFNSSDDNDLVYFGAGSYCEGKKVIEKAGDFVHDVDEKMKMSILRSTKDPNEFSIADDGQFNLSPNKKHEKLDEFSIELVSTKSDTVSSPGSCSELNNSVNEARPEILKGPDYCREHRCSTCFKVFSSGRALGGHKRAHYKHGFSSENKNEEAITMPAMNNGGDVEVSEDLFDLNFPATIDEGRERKVRIGLWRGLAN